MTQSLEVAYFSMEVALKSEIPTYAGGLGVLAGDLMHSCADLKIPAAAITICWQHGYLRQFLQPDGTQRYEDMLWEPERYMERLKEKVTVWMEGRNVAVGGWVYRIVSGDHTVPIYFLDTDLEENSPQDREITNHLYGGDGAMRIKQELVLGIGGVRMLRALGYSEIRNYHMNEGHAAFLTLELLRERGFKDDEVKKSCVFTTHTPIKAGHDVFDYDLAWRVAGDSLPWHIRQLAGEDGLSMTHLALSLSRYTFGVSQIHGQVARGMFPGEEIDAITNGSHHIRWASSEMKTLLDKYAQGWREDPALLTKICRDLPDDEVWSAHQAAKKRLVDYVNMKTEYPFDPNILTIASARRIVQYKRPDILYTNLLHLKEIGSGRLQVIHAGNAHPADTFAQEMIRKIVAKSKELRGAINVVYLPNYNLDLAHLLTSGADVWLNTPMRLHEASGTSGMKACLNGVLNLSSLDGWWIEGYRMDTEAGWRIGPLARALETEDQRKAVDAEDLYTQLMFEVIPEYYRPDRRRWMRRMKRAIGIAGYFNTHRCIREYQEKAWGVE